tara:strand:+ start:1883 stop:3016 length:1134 start_codon:yes stop_codon:yes gene_type:complete
MTELFNLAACKALHMSQPSPPKISIGIEIGQPPMNGGLSSIQESMNIGGEPHRLSYINSDEASLLKQLGGSGQLVNGIPAYIDAGEGMGGYGSDDAADTGGFTDTGIGPDIDEAAPTGPKAQAEADALAAARGLGVGIADYTTKGVDPDEPGYLSSEEMAKLSELPEGFHWRELYRKGLLREKQVEAMVRANMRSTAKGRAALNDPNMNWKEYFPYLGPAKGKKTIGGQLAQSGAKALVGLITSPAAGLLSLAMPKDFGQKLANAVTHSIISGWWGKSAWHDDAGISLDYDVPDFEEGPETVEEHLKVARPCAPGEVGWPECAAEEEEEDDTLTGMAGYLKQWQKREAQDPYKGQEEFYESIWGPDWRAILARRGNA